MLLWMRLLLYTLFVSTGCYSLDVLKLPKSLSMGASSSSYQVEGAWNEDGKEESIWDRFTQSSPDRIKDGSNGNVACDAYHKTDEDVALIKDFGLDHYRFSLSWPRILPTGFANYINQEGVDYYNKLIDTLIANKIVPMVTIFHWDLPQSLQDLGGLTNPEIADWMEEYAKVVFDKFGDRVKTWITINEPREACQYGYETGMLAPGIDSLGIGVYLCGHNLIKAHAKIYHLYDQVYRRSQKGRIAMVIACSWSEPATNTTEDIKAADRKRQFDFGMYAHPIYSKNGDYPEVVKREVAKRSKLEGFPTSRLPKFTPQEVRFIRGTYDFFGLNHYTTYYARNKAADPIGYPSQTKDTRVDSFQDDNWLSDESDQFRLVPWGMRKALNYIKNNYGDPVVLITENGFPDSNAFNDTNRIRFYNETLSEVLKAIHYDKVKVQAYTAWSLMDSFEWNSGYTLHFGFYHVDFTDPDRPRTPKSSVAFYKNILQTRRL